jgi:hypothetical protein
MSDQGYKGTFVLGSFDLLPIDMRCALVVYLTRALATIDYLYLKFHRDTPSLYQSHVVYRNQTWGDDQWWDIPTLMSMGKGACEDFVAWRVAELTLAGEAAKVDVITQQDRAGRVVYHVVVKRENGTIEDPSALLGMTTGKVDPKILQIRAQYNASLQPQTQVAGSGVG